MKVGYLMLLVLFLSSSKLFSQPQFLDSVVQLTRTQFSRSYFDDSKGKYFGCELNVHCKNLVVFFKTFQINKRRRSVTFDLYVQPTLRQKDTIGLNYFMIFLAKPKGDRLENIEVIAKVHNDTIFTSGKSYVWPKAGHVFISDRKIKRKKRLYVSSVSIFKLLEYDLSLFFIKPQKQNLPAIR